MIIAVLFSILRMLQFRCIMTQTMKIQEKTIKIEAKISSYKILIVELEMNKYARKVYTKEHKRLCERLDAEIDSITEKDKVNQITHRVLFMTIFNSALTKITARFAKKTIKINKFHSTLDDHDATQYYKYTRSD